MDMRMNRLFVGMEDLFVLIECLFCCLVWKVSEETMIFDIVSKIIL